MVDVRPAHSITDTHDDIEIYRWLEARYGDKATSRRENYRRSRQTGRHARLFWTVAPDTHCVAQTIGWDCSPWHPGCWWFPEVGYTLTEEHSAFRDRRLAILKAREAINQAHAELDRQSAALDRLEALGWIGAGDG